MRSSITRKTEAAVATLAPDEPVVDTGYAWVFADSGRVPKLFRARRRSVVARTGDRMLVWPVPSARRQLVGVRPLLDAPLDQLTVERYARARVLGGLRVRTSAGATIVFELTPRARGFGGRLETAIDAVPVRPDVDMDAPAPAAPAAAGAGSSGATPPVAEIAITRGEVLKIITDLRDGRLQPAQARAWAVAVAGSPVADDRATDPTRASDPAAIGEIVARLGAIGTGTGTAVDRAQLDGWITQLSGP